jgi:hypothetical protein
MDAGTPFSSSITGILLVYVGSTQHIVESAGRVQFVTVVFEHDAGFGVLTQLKLVRCPLARSYPRHFTFYVADPVSSVPANASLTPRSLGTSLTFE